MLTPADIDSQRFSTTRLKEGYVQEEVDDFLDGLAEDVKFLQAQAARLEEENRTLRRQLDLRGSEGVTSVIPAVAQTPSAVAEKLLAAAQTAHDQHVADGQAKADALVRDGGTQAARLVEEATAVAERIKSEGLAEKYRRSDELETKIGKLTAAVENLQAKGGQIRRAMNDAITTYDNEVPQ